MTNNREQKSSTIGIEQFTIFPFDTQKLEYGEPIPLTTLKSISVSMNVATYDEYNDNSLFEVISKFSNAEISCEFTALTPREQSLILGGKGEGAVQFLSNNDVAKPFAVAYKRTKADGNAKFVKFLYCSARLEGVDGKTASDSIEVQPDKIIFKAKPLEENFPIEKYRGVVKMEVDSSDLDYNGEGDTWFDTALLTAKTEDINKQTVTVTNEDKKGKKE